MKIKDKSEFCIALTNHGSKIKVKGWTNDTRRLCWCEIESREKNYVNSIALEDIEMNDNLREFLDIKDKEESPAK